MDGDRRRRHCPLDVARRRERQGPPRADAARGAERGAQRPDVTLTGFDVGDRVYCLAWVGTPFEVVARSDGMLSLQGLNGSDAQVDIFDETSWMLTREPWDKIWYWPDRAGERYD